jgi:hypothetical protein
MKQHKCHQFFTQDGGVLWQVHLQFFCGLRLRSDRVLASVIVARFYILTETGDVGLCLTGAVRKIFLSKRTRKKEQSVGIFSQTEHSFQMRSL